MNPAQFETTARVVALVCHTFHVTPAQLESPSRVRDLVWPRHIAMLLIRRHAKLTTTHIGYLFGRCHASVLYAMKSLEREVQTNRAAAREVAILDTAIANTEVSDRRAGVTL